MKMNSAKNAAWHIACVYGQYHDICRGGLDVAVVLSHARSLPKHVDMEGAAHHSARANLLESLAAPVVVRYDVAHIGVHRACLAPDGERNASMRWTWLVHPELPEQELPRLRPPCAEIRHIRRHVIIIMFRINILHTIMCVPITMYNVMLIFRNMIIITKT